MTDQTNNPNTSEGLDEILTKLRVNLMSSRDLSGELLSSSLLESPDIKLSFNIAKQAINAQILETLLAKMPEKKRLCCDAECHGGIDKSYVNGHTDALSEIEAMLKELLG